ncbi:MAG: ERF family protein [Planctomycetota bacterium]|jgi:hypothetical protein
MIQHRTALLHLPDSFDPGPDTSLLCAKLARKKNKVVKLVQGIRKTGYNDYDEYAFVEEAEVVRVLRSALTEAGLSLSVSASEILRSDAIATGTNYTLKMTFTLTDTETGYAEVIPWLAMGADAGDKALYKAYTSGVKYFLLKTFLLPTDDDVERNAVSEFAPMDPVSAEIMTQLEGYFRQKVPEGARFDRSHFYEAVWEHFKAWPSVPGAAARIKDIIDIRQTVVWEGGKPC